MYKFIYYYLYLAYSKKNTEIDAKWWAAALTFVTLNIHILIIFAIIERFIGYNVIQYPTWLDTMSYGRRKYTLLPFYAIVFVFFGRYFNKRKGLLEKKYEGREMLTLKNLLLVLLASIGSIVLLVILTPPR